MTKTIALVVARADIVGHVELKQEAPESLTVPAGCTLQVKLLFSFSEVSRHRDDFRIEMQSSFAGDGADPVGHSHHDRRGLADDQQGFIMQHYDDVPPGDHLLTYNVRAEYREGGEHEHVDLHGQVMITAT